jgi:hypothetical protein
LLPLTKRSGGGLMGDFGAPLTERVLAGSGVCLQLNTRVQGWRWVPGAALERIRARGMEPVGWSPWTGSPESFTRLSIPRHPVKWCVLAGELPSPGSKVIVTTDDGGDIPAESIEGQLWACEWPGPPFGATVSVNDGPAVAVSFFSRVPRRMHYGTEQPEHRVASPGRVLWGYYRHASETRPDE